MSSSKPPQSKQAGKTVSYISSDLSYIRSQLNQRADSLSPCGGNYYFGNGIKKLEWSLGGAESSLEGIKKHFGWKDTHEGKGKCGCRRECCWACGR
ncbi:hypothetical protein BT69DRAFT_1280370 [Atractiella rhizophila]|nr:hypothetical protein BT69DRAFT_1280370 [Atractiella rhizophila]